MENEPEVAQGFLMAAVYAQALRQDVTPRDIVEGLWKAMPGSDAWPGFREALVETLEEHVDDGAPPAPPSTVDDDLGPPTP